MLDEMRRQRLELKTTVLNLNLKWKMAGKMAWNTTCRITGARGSRTRAVAAVVALGVGVLTTGALQARAQTSTSGSTSTDTPTTPRPLTSSKIGPAAPVTYGNTYELYGGINFMNFQAGQDLPTRMNLGGGELLGTYWLNQRLGVAADYRFDAGTTPVLANPGVRNRPLVYLHIGMLGAQYRGPKNQYVAVNFHAYAGVGAGIFDYSLKDIPVAGRGEIGLYTNRVKPMAALGGSVDFNRSKRWAVRISPDLILEHFGTETREFVSVSGGVVYRFGNK